MIGYCLCYPGEKIPIGNDWQHHLLSTDDVLAAFAKNPHYNLGIVLGPDDGDGGIIDVECDSEEATKRYEELFPKVRTPCWQSAKGQHHVFKYDARFAGLGAVVKLFGIEFRLGANGKGAQSVCPPSIANGVRREWIVKPEDCEIASLSESVIALLLAQPKTKPRPPAVDLPEARNTTVARLQRYCQRHNIPIQGITTGWHDCTFLYLAVCPFKSPTNEKGAPAFIIFPDGGFVFKCLHAGCHDKHFSDIEEIYGPLRPTIKVDADLLRGVNQAIAALADDPNVFQKDGILVEPVHQPTKPPQCLVEDGSPQLHVISPPRLMAKLADLAKFEKRSAQQKQAVACLPSPQIVSAVSASPVYPGIPTVIGMASAPILRHDGSIATKPGYDDQTGMYLDFDGDFPALMPPPEAVTLFDDLLCDFPFVGGSNGAHKSVWVAALVTLLSRSAFAGSAPFFLFDANTSRVGKGLLTDLLGIILGNDRAARYARPENDDEWRKVITSVALSGSPYLLIDNIKGKFDGAAVEAALTTGRWQDRLLGRNRQVDLPLTFVWLGTSNNAVVGRDIVGRTCSCRMETSEEHPELRDTFKHPDLIGYTKDRWRQLAMAALSIPAGYIKAGRPPHKLPAWGGFQQWSNLVRNSLVWAGLTDPDTRQAFAEYADDETDILSRVVDGWSELGEGSHTVAHAVEQANSGNAPILKQLLTELGGEPSRVLGTLLRDSRRRAIGGRCFVKPSRKAAKWQLVNVENKPTSCGT